MKIANMRTLAERPVEIYEGTAGEAIVIGEALVLTSGALTKCGATAVPEFIAISAGTATPIAVVRVMEEDKYATTFSADGSSLNVGDKVTIASDGVRVTATKANGTGVSGDKVEGMFRR